MALPINISDIHFGERDALDEFTKQDRQGNSILDNSFVLPPRIKIQELENGSRFLIVGPKGSGKTTLIWHLKIKMPHSQSKMVLFKSDLRREDRDRLDRMVDFVVVEDQRKFRTESDYKTVWEWYLMKNIFRLVERDHVLEGQKLYDDIRSLLDIKGNRLNTIYDNFHVETIKGKIGLSLESGVLKSELAAEVEAKKNGNEINFLDLVRLIQDAVTRIVFTSTCSIRLFFDELEFFMEKDGYGERDQRLVRDLLFSINSTNRLFSGLKADIAVLASVRSEILTSISAGGQEIEKVIDAFSVKLNWFHRDTESHPVLKIFDNKMKYSEIEIEGAHSDDPWLVYFPPKITGQNIKQYLLDLGLHRPRGVVLRIMAALEIAEESTRFDENDFLSSEEIFGRNMLQEFVDEINASFDNIEVDNILSLFKGNSYSFTISDLNNRLQAISRIDAKKAKKLREIKLENIVKLLYRIGMIGNQFDLEARSGETLSRDSWSFRGEPQAIMEKRFIIHKSIRKVLKTV